MVRASKQTRIDGFNADEKAKNYTEAELNTARSILKGIATLKLPKLELEAIPMQGGVYGYHGSFTTQIDGSDVAYQVTVVHPASKAIDDVKLQRAFHILSNQRKAENAKQRGAETLVNTLSKMSKAERLALAAQLMQAETDDDDESDDDEAE